MRPQYGCMATNSSSPASFLGAGRLAYRTGGFPSHGVAAMRAVLGRDLTAQERQGIVDGWAAERREVGL